MAMVLDVAEDQQGWGTFDQIRERLFDQFQDVVFAPETGLSSEELQQEVDDYLQACCDHPPGRCCAYF